MGIEDDVRELGGVAKASALLRRGWSRRGLREAVHLGLLLRVRKGHYAVVDLDPMALMAFRVGGRLAGSSALRAHGIWVANTAAALSVAVPANAHGLRQPDDPRSPLLPGSVRISWDAKGTGPEPETAAAALMRIAGSVPAAVLFACFESAIRGGHLTRHAADRLRARFIRSVSPHFAHADGVAESGAESLLKFWLIEQGIAFRQQVRIAGVGRVDFVLGRWQIVEVDGAGFHSSPEEFERDRRRDVVASALGYRTIRCSAKLAEREPELLRSAIRAAARRGDIRP